MKASICISTYGDDYWRDLARSRARPSAETQGVQVIVHHDRKGTIATARNEAAFQADGDWLCFLDADDELEPGYIDAMARQLEQHPPNGRLLLTPAVSYVVKGKRRPPKFWPEAPLSSHNWLVIGTLVERDFFFEVGGFRDWGDPPGSNAYEDWALWATCWQQGATPVKVKRAVYVAHQEATSRHRIADRTLALDWHYEIGSTLFPESYPESWPSLHGRPLRRRVR